MKPTVRVTWIDAQDSPHAWASEEDVEAFSAEHCTIVSVGFQVSKTDKYLTLAGDWDEVDKNYGRVTKIPVAWLVQVEELHGA